MKSTSIASLCIRLGTIVAPSRSHLLINVSTAQAYQNATFALIAARAWLGSRTIDCLERLALSNANLNQIAVSGHSRNGKQSLIFAAIDERIGAVVGSSPG